LYAYADDIIGGRGRPGRALVERGQAPGRARKPDRSASHLFVLHFRVRGFTCRSVRLLTGRPAAVLRSSFTIVPGRVGELEDLGRLRCRARWFLGLALLDELALDLLEDLVHRLFGREIGVRHRLTSHAVCSTGTC